MSGQDRSAATDSREREIYAEIAHRKQREASVERMRRAYEKAERERQWTAPWDVPSPLLRGDE